MMEKIIKEKEKIKMKNVLYFNFIFDKYYIYILFKKLYYLLFFKGNKTF